MKRDLLHAVIPAQAGILIDLDRQKLDPGLRRGVDQKRKHVAAHLARALVVVLLALSMSPAIAAAPAAHVRAPPDLHQRVGFDQELGAQVPLDTLFHEASGKAIHLRGLLHGKPVLLVPGYFTCKTLCSVVRTGVAKGVRGTGFTPGTQFDVVLVSIDPKETPADARHAQQMDTANHPGAGVAQWHYLTGSQTSIAPLMHGIGFRYMFDARSDQFDHATGIVVLTPEGKVSQYLFGVKFPAETLRLALVHASHGKVGNIIDRLVLLCCQYDTSTGRYTLTVHRIMQGLGISFAVLLAGFVVFLRRSETHRTREPS
jgi:protein SCO1/2